MTFDSLERSNYDAEPIALYSFSLGSMEWHYASSEVPITLNIAGKTVVFEPVAISDNGVSNSGEIAADDFVVTVPTDIEFIRLFYGTPPSMEAYVTVRNRHASESEAPVVGVYLVRSAKRSTALGWEVTCRALTASLNRNGLRLGWARGCQNALYDQNCKVDPDQYKRSIRVEGLTGVSIISTGLTALPDSYLTGGYFEWLWMPGVIERRAIEMSSGSVILVLGNTDGLKVGMMVDVFPGCSRVANMCNDRFKNIDNYGGFPHMPGKSPFDGDPVF